MKRNLIKAQVVFFLIATFSFKSFSQSNAQWLLNGTSAYYNSGLVGIGTTNPQNNLTITGTMGIYGTGLDGTTYQRAVIYSDINNGLYFDAPLKPDGNGLPINFSWRGGSPKITFLPSGNVGIGITTPQSALHVAGTKSITWSDIYTSNYAAGTGLVTIGDKGGNGSLFINTPSHSSVYPAGLGIDGSYDADSRTSLINIKALGVWYSSWSSNLAFYTTNGTTITEAMRIDASGNIGIGTTQPGYKLDVCGTIRAREVKVDLLGSCTPDFVFAPTYKLRPLSEVEKYVKANSHLPEIPSAAEVEKNGLSLGEMQNKLLQKVEELTLYVIEQQKNDQYLLKQIEELKKENEILKKAMLNNQK